jgi:formylmethanofuran dehydrogenase subunit E-like metal-binding protein
LSVVQNIIPKEVSKTHPTATILTTQDKARNYTYSKIKRLTEGKIRKISTFFIQKKCDYRLEVNFGKNNTETLPL